MSNKGIVCEIKNEYCVFLTADGQFVRGIPISADVQIGDEAVFHEWVEVAKKPSPFKRAMFPIITAAAVLMILFATVLNPSQSVHAYVQVNGIEAVEFGLDEDGHVVEVRSLNGGELELKTDVYKGKPLEEVIVDMIDYNEEQPVPLSITTVFTSKAEGDKSKQAIEQAITAVKEKYDTNELSVFEATEQDREEANQKGVTIQHHLNPKKQAKDKDKKDPKEQKNPKADPKNNTSPKKSQPTANPNADKNPNDKEKNPGSDQGKSSNGNLDKPKNNNNDREQKDSDQKQDKPDEEDKNGHDQKGSKEKGKADNDPEEGNGKGNGGGNGKGNGNGNNGQKEKGNKNEGQGKGD